MEREFINRILKNEIERTTGCTDPVTVSLAVSRATRELGCIPEKVVVTVSPNLYKNAICVGVPGTGMHGMYIAGALGAVIDHSEAGLAILDYLTEAKLDEAKAMLEEGRVKVGWKDTDEVLYVRAEVFSGGEQAYAVIAGDYSNIIEVGCNDRATHTASAGKARQSAVDIQKYTIQELFTSIESMNIEELNFLLEAARVNRNAAEERSNQSGLHLGPSLRKRTRDLPRPFSTIDQAQAWTGAAGEARMVGLKVPIIAIAGSGNQGITNFLGVLAVAEDLDSSDAKLAKALAISSMITVYIRSYMNRLSPMCGCAIAAAPGVAAATSYLLGGSLEDMVHAMQSVIGTLVGVLCDGAKESCAYKLSMAVNIAVQAAYFAIQGTYIPSGAGLIGNTIEETIANLGRLNAAMAPVDRAVLELIEEMQPNRREAEKRVRISD
jgi:L-cysteine desulfidase